MLLVAAVLLAVFVVPSPWNALLVAAAATVEAAEVWLFVRLSRRRRAQVGVEALVGTLAEVVEDCRPEGRVRVAGELWRARAEHGDALAGERVRIRAVADGLTLLVEPERGA